MSAQAQETSFETDEEIELESATEIEGRKVLLIFADQSKPRVAAKVVADGPTHIIYKPKGKSQTVLLAKSDLADVVLDESEDAPLTQTSLKPVKNSQVKRHLVDRHGLMLSEVNEMTEGEAAVRHDDLHRIHQGDVGHNHNKTDEAVEQSDDSTDSDAGE